MGDYSPGWAELLSVNTVGTHTEDPPGWEDLRFPVQGINPIGSAAPPTIDNSADGFPGTLLFAGNAENVIAGLAQLPHSWVEGSVIHPHIHWAKTDSNAGDVGWQFRYRRSNRDGEWTTWSTWVDHVLVGEQAGHSVSSFSVIDMTGYVISSMIAWSVRRTGNTDSYASDARLFEFDIHHQINSIGSSEEGAK